MPRSVHVDAPPGVLGLELSDSDDGGVRVQGIKPGSPLRLPSGRLLVGIGWVLVSVDGLPIEGGSEGCARVLRANAERVRRLEFLAPTVSAERLRQSAAFFATMVAVLAIFCAIDSWGLLPEKAAHWLASGRDTAAKRFQRMISLINS